MCSLPGESVPQMSGAALFPQGIGFRRNFPTSFTTRPRISSRSRERTAARVAWAKQRSAVPTAGPEFKLEGARSALPTCRFPSSWSVTTHCPPIALCVRQRKDRPVVSRHGPTHASGLTRTTEPCCQSCPGSRDHRSISEPDASQGLLPNPWSGFRRQAPRVAPRKTTPRAPYESQENMAGPPVHPRSSRVRHPGLRWRGPTLSGTWPARLENAPVSLLGICGAIGG
jgi:hypothetical protein